MTAPRHSHASVLLLPALRGLLILGLAVAASSDALAEEVRRFEQTYYAGDSQRIEIELSFGSLEVVGTDGGNARVEFSVDCRRDDVDKCRRRADRIRLRPRLIKGTLHLELLNTPRGQAQGLDARMRVEIPSHLGLEIDMSGGDVTVSGMRNDLEVDSAGGSVDITYPQDSAQLVKVDVGFGQADLFTRDGNRIAGSGWPRSIKWFGTGTTKVEVDVGGGEAEIRLH